MLLPVSDRIHLPEAFSALLAEAATAIDLTVDWRQPPLRYDASGLQGVDLWLCKAQAGPVYVDDGKPMDVRSATVDMLGRLMRQAHAVVMNSEAEERRSRRHDVRLQAYDRAAKAREALVVLERTLRRMPEVWPEPARSEPAPSA